MCVCRLHFISFSFLASNRTLRSSPLSLPPVLWHFFSRTLFLKARALAARPTLVGDNKRGAFFFATDWWDSVYLWLQLDCVLLFLALCNAHVHVDVFCYLSLWALLPSHCTRCFTRKRVVITRFTSSLLALATDSHTLTCRHVVLEGGK